MFSGEWASAATAMASAFFSGGRGCDDDGAPGAPTPTRAGRRRLDVPPMSHPSRKRARGTRQAACEEGGEEGAYAPPPTPPLHAGGGRGRGASPRANGNSSPRWRRTGAPKLNELLIETSPMEGGVAPSLAEAIGPVSPAVGSREIRARPLDVDKELPLFIQDDAPPGADDTPLEPTLGLTPLAPLAPLERTSSLDATDITVPVCRVVEMIGPPRRFRRPPQLIRHKATYLSSVVEYEMDEEDWRWLERFNAAHLQPVLDADRFEEIIDVLEKTSFHALHGSANSVPPALPPLAPPKRPPPPPAALTPRLPKPLKRVRATSSLSKPATKTNRPSRPERPPPPTDDELKDLPLGLCRRYQQGRCHKGRSCKWKHELWRRRSAAEMAQQQQAEAEAARAAAAGGVAPSVLEGAVAVCTDVDPDGEGVEDALVAELDQVVGVELAAIEDRREGDACGGEVPCGREEGAAGGSGGELVPTGAMSREYEQAAIEHHHEQTTVGEGTAAEQKYREEADAEEADGEGEDADGENDEVEGEDDEIDVEVLDGELIDGDDIDGEAEAEGENDGEEDLERTGHADVPSSSDVGGMLFKEEGPGLQPPPISTVDSVASFLPDGLADPENTSIEVKQLLETPICFDGDPDDPHGLCDSTIVASDGGMGGSMVTHATGAGAAPVSRERISDFGVPRTCLREILRGSMRILLAVWDYWRRKRHHDSEKLPLLSRLRREAAEMKARHARLSTTHSELYRLRSHLVRVRHLLSLVKRREKLKHQIAALTQVLFEARLEAPRPEVAPVGATAPNMNYGTRGATKAFEI
ncbi:hypothetical protein AB1Y20_018981 [Prymnesium parvum]|uniref:Enhancer of polycomb-like protein n=1 Tax=Prymnesium parvum TaxID=97485 RepID=A0AB34JQ55_PRYPA